MEKERHEENNHIISGVVMAKRKRGRPRKQVKLGSSEPSIAPSPGLRKIQQQPSQRDDDGAMVGKAVSGVIEATFEAGFLLSVKIGDSDIMLRGVVFKPGGCDPVSVENDVAPGVPMIRRNTDTVLHQASAKGGRKSSFREKRGSDVSSRALVHVPSQPARPTIPNHMLVPVVLQPVNPQNGGLRIPVRYGPQQIETGSQVNGASNGKPYEKVLTHVMKEGQAHKTAQSIGAESDEQALSIEPLQAIHPVHPVHVPKPVPSNGGGKMTELLQAVQENVKETQEQ